MEVADGGGGGGARGGGGVAARRPVSSSLARVSRLPGATRVSGVGAYQARRRQPSSLHFGRGRSIPLSTAPSLFPPLVHARSLLRERYRRARGPAAAGEKQKREDAVRFVPGDT